MAVDGLVYVWQFLKETRIDFFGGVIHTVDQQYQIVF